MTRHLLKAWRHLTALLKQLNGQTASFITRFANHLTAYANRTATPAAHPDHRTRKIDPDMDRERLAQELKSDEGIISHAYQDHLGYWTIGIGRLIDRRKGGGLSEDEIMMLLGNDIAKVHQQVRAALPWFDNLTDGRKRALCNMAFQMGINGLLGFKNTLALIQAGKYSEAADNALKSKWATQTPARAKRVAEMIRKG